MLVIFLVSCVLYMSLGFTRPLASPDEGRYTEIPREMLEHSDMVTPRLNDMPYFYKPPMFYWMQAASLKAFGINLFSARLANSLMAVFGICAAYCAARALYGRRAGILSAAFLATFLLYYALGQIVTLDMAVSVFISAAMFCFIIALKSSAARRGILTLGFFAFCALSVETCSALHDEDVGIACVVLAAKLVSARTDGLEVTAGANAALPIVLDAVRFVTHDETSIIMPLFHALKAATVAFLDSYEA